MSDPQQALVPIETHDVEFYGDTLIGALVEVDGERRIYVPVRPLCRYLGVDWSAQRQRIDRDEVLYSERRFVVITTTNPGVGGDPEVLCLPLDMIPGFLFGISVARVKPELQERITLYRRECYRALWERFKFDILPPMQTLAPQAPVSQSGAALAYEIATAVQHLARQQLEAEQRLDGRIDSMGRWAKGVESRLGTIEFQLGPKAAIDDSQAAALAQAVRNVGRLLEARGAGDYRGVYSQLYARFGISSYKNLPREQFEQALAWLHAWFTEIGGETSAAAGKGDG